MEFMKIYINQGRFGEFVSEIARMRNEQKKEEAEKEENNRLWTAYLLSGSDKPFLTWKDELTIQPEPQETVKKSNSLSMTDSEVEAAKNKARDILKGFKI